jgi:hypothetical protein
MNSSNIIPMPQFPDPEELWVRCLRHLDWRPRNIRAAINASFTRAIYLDIAPCLAVEEIERVCAKHHHPVSSDELWNHWFSCVRELNGQPDEPDLDAA